MISDLFADTVKFDPDLLWWRVQLAFPSEPRPIFIREVVQALLEIQLRHFVQQSLLLRWFKLGDRICEIVDRLHGKHFLVLLMLQFCVGAWQL
jgi:hypothetical protein